MTIRYHITSAVSALVLLLPELLVIGPVNEWGRKTAEKEGRLIKHNEPARDVKSIHKRFQLPAAQELRRCFTLSMRF